MAVVKGLQQQIKTMIIWSSLGDADKVTMNSMSSIQSDAVPMNHMVYRRFLKTLDDGLGSDDCNKLCFIVADVGIPKSKLEKCRNATDIFDELEKRSYIAANDVGLLWTLMDLIHRKDLLRKIDSYRSAIKFARPINASGVISDFRLLLLKIADYTNGAELEQIKYACTDLLGRQALSKCRDIYQIFSLLEERGMISPTHLDFLIELLHLVQNYDIVAKVLEFKEKQTPSAGPTDEELAKLSSKLGNEWQQLATYLGIAYHKIQAINRDFRLTEDKIRSMLFAWRQKLSSQDNSYGSLAIALRKCGRVDLAEFVRSWSFEQVRPAPSPLHTTGPIAQPTQPDIQYVPPDLAQFNLMKPSDFSRSVTSTPSLNTGIKELGSSDDCDFLDPILRDLSEHIVVEWMKLGTYLKLQYSMLMRIDRDFHNSSDKAFEMLKTWHQGLPPGTDALGTLASVLKVVGRLDLSERIKGIKSPTIYLEKQLKPTNGQPASETTSETIPENKTEVKQPETDIKTEPMEVSPAPAPASYNFPQQESFPEYRMNRNPRGLCMIINNEQFSGGKMSERKGSERDAGKLNNLFSKLHFEVDVRNNLESHQMVHWLKNVSQLNHSDYDCFVCCIMSHGKLGVVYGSDSEEVEIQDILSYFKPVSCPSLGYKPKLFFIQACQGTVDQEGVDLQTDKPLGIGSGMPKTLPNEADFLLSYATVPGYTSFRSATSGSWYVNALVDEITKYHNEVDLIRILVRVNASLSARDGNRNKTAVKQVAAPTYTLQKDVYLRTLDK